MAKDAAQPDRVKGFPQRMLLAASLWLLSEQEHGAQGHFHGLIPTVIPDIATDFLQLLLCAIFVSFLLFSKTQEASIARLRLPGILKEKHFMKTLECR